VADDMQTLLDREDIREVRANLAWALDTRDWDLFASLFLDEVDVDLSALGAPAGRMPRARVLAVFQHSFRRPVHEMGTQQLYGCPVISLVGDTATVRSYLLGHHHVPGLEGGEEVELRAAYTDQLVRTLDGWKIQATTLRLLSLVGNPTIFA
jgi:hypothetical protein